MINDPNKLCKLAQGVLEDEARAILQLKERINADFVRACQLLMGCRGRIVVTGMGKSGHVGRKIAATLASTGSPAFSVHPGEAGHGDMGMITPDDVVLALSNSGETDEILTLLPIIKRLGITLITLTGNPNSTLARNATINIDVSVDHEACPLNLAPTCSTTAALAMGDALAVALLQIRGFTRDDFAQSHPSGKLGRRLLLKVSDLMHTGSAVPAVEASVTVRDALLEMSHKGLGLTAVVTPDQTLLGIFTDGDLRRALDRGVDIHTTRMSTLVNSSCVTCEAGILATEALQMMEKTSINALLVTGEKNRLLGAITMHDLLKARII